MIQNNWVRRFISFVCEIKNIPIDHLTLKAPSKFVADDIFFLYFP